MSQSPRVPYRLDFQEAVSEIVSAYINEARTELDGRVYRIRRTSNKKVIFEFYSPNQTLDDWNVVLPTTDMYLAKWEPIASGKELVHADPYTRSNVSIRRGGPAARSHFKRKGAPRRSERGRH